MRKGGEAGEKTVSFEHHLQKCGIEMMGEYKAAKSPLTLRITPRQATGLALVTKDFGEAYAAMDSPESEVWMSCWWKQKELLESLTDDSTPSRSSQPLSCAISQDTVIAHLFNTFEPYGYCTMLGSQTDSSHSLITHNYISPLLASKMSRGFKQGQK